MKMFEILMESPAEEIAAVIAGLTAGSMHSITHKANFAITQAMKMWPDVVYSGPLYRVVFIPAPKFIAFKNNSQVLNYIKNYDAGQSVFDQWKPAGASKREYFSWAKSAKSVGKFLNISNNYGGDDYQEHTWESIQVGVLIQHQSTGLDIKKAMKHINKNSAKVGFNNLHLAAKVDEVMAPMSNTIQVRGYHVIGIGDRVYSDDDVFSDQDDEDFDREAVNNLRWEANYFLPSSQFNQVQQLLQKQYIGKTPGDIKTPKVHKKSPIKKYEKAMNTEIDWD